MDPNPENQVEGELTFPQEAMTKEEAPQSDENSKEPSLTKVPTAGVDPYTFKPTPRLFIAFGTLAVITLMVALDGTSLSVALPVSAFSFFGISLVLAGGKSQASAISKA